ncbi:protealysin inhibitor emfourin [Comamonas antarctica]|uniref:Uncharacterized protein n=1 Tax=Comamonas antarctica TaxID=2743470 RepID=A0A6N1X0Z6_9BURK|nr:protealysin inhibitor emfourin [Comamonas antarctica]QKV53039.1 hypothetical protein HUK68_09145 [Comamonas antarctica]
MQFTPLSSSPVSGWGRIDIERYGGLAGYGMPGSRIRSRGYFMAQDLSAADQALLREIFLSPSEAPTWVRDAFRYHLTRQSDCGPQTVVVAESMVPEVLRDALHDELLPREPAPPHPDPGPSPPKDKPPTHAPPKTGAYDKP